MTPLSGKIQILNKNFSIGSLRTILHGYSVILTESLIHYNYWQGNPNFSKQVWKPDKLKKLLLGKQTIVKYFIWALLFFFISVRHLFFKSVLHSLFFWLYIYVHIDSILFSSSIFIFRVLITQDFMSVCFVKNKVFWSLCFENYQLRGSVFSSFRPNLRRLKQESLRVYYWHIYN